MADAGPIKDIRNRSIPHTDTYFTMKRYATLAEWESRKQHLRRQVLSAAGLWPIPEKTPLNAQVFGRIERISEGFSIEKVLLETMPGYYLGGNLYRPLERGKKRPAVLHTHGHYQYGRIEHQHRIHRTVRSEAGQAREHRYPDQVAWAAPMSSPPTMAMNLAMQGYVVFLWDMVGYNDTIQTPHTFGTNRQKLWSFGPLGLQLWNATRALDFVQSLDDVDPTRIGMTGSSGGGSQTFLLSAVDERVKVAAPVVMVGGVMQGGSACENASGLRFETYNTELAALTAPRPMILVGSPTDQSQNTLTEDAPAIRSIYDLYGEPERLEAVMVDAPHNYNRFSREAVRKFFAKHLLPDAARDEFEEQALRIGPPNTLLALHNRTLPENALTFDGLFEQWRQMSQRQSEAVTNNHALRERLALALAVDWPERVAATTEGETLTLSREGVGDHIPARWREGSADTALVVHENGSVAAERTEIVRTQRTQGTSTLLIDAFQTGAAQEQRNFRFQDNRRERGYYLTFNRSGDANRVQDILTALAYLKSKKSGHVRLIGLGKAAIWTTFAAALAPIDLTLCADTANFEGRDEDFLKQFFVPGIQRAGGWNAALQLTKQFRSEGCSDVGK